MSSTGKKGSAAERAPICISAIDGDKPPLSAAELAVLLCVRRGSLDRTLNFLRLESNKQIYVADYRRPSNTNGGGAWIPLYKAGNLPDMPVPRPTAEEERERRATNSRRQNARKREQERDQERTEKYQPALDPFSLALFGRAA